MHVNHTPACNGKRAHLRVFLKGLRLQTGQGVAIDARSLSVSIGTEVFGVDLARGLLPVEVQAVWAVLLEWKVVFFRYQSLDHARHVEFARQLGQPRLSADSCRVDYALESVASRIPPGTHCTAGNSSCGFDGVLVMSRLGKTVLRRIWRLRTSSRRILRGRIGNGR